MVIASPTGQLGSSATRSTESSAQARTCAQCGSAVVRRRRNSRQNEALCAACDQRERRAAYFRSYYEVHKDRILDKNRRWARDNKSRIVQLRQARRVRDTDIDELTKTCVDCDTPVTRALRCRKCYIRFRYATDSAYRSRRLATTRRWLSKRQTEAMTANRRTASRTQQALNN